MHMKDFKTCLTTAALHNLTSLNPGEYVRLGKYILETLENDKDAHMATLCGLMYAFGLTLDDSCRCIAGQHRFHRISPNGTVLLKINPKLVAIDIDNDDLIEIPLDIPKVLSEQLMDEVLVEEISKLWNQNKNKLEYQYKCFIRKLRKDIGSRYTQYIISSARNNILLQDYDDPILLHIVKGGLPKNYPSGCHYINLSTARARDAHRNILNKLFGDNCIVINPESLMPDWHIGTDLPNDHLIKKHVIELKNKIFEIKSRDIDSIVDIFNAYSLYTVTMLYFGTGCRPVIDSFSKLSLASEKERLLTIRDKVSTKERSLRVVGIPNTVVDQINYHRRMCGYVSAWLIQLGDSESGKRRERCQQLAYELRLISNGKISSLHRFFKIDKAKLLPCAIRPQDICIVSSHDALNLGRKWYASYLYNNQVPYSWIKGLLGHNYDKRHSIGVVTDIPRIHILQQCLKIIEDGLSDLGFIALSPPLKNKVRTLPAPNTRISAMKSGESQREENRLALYKKTAEHVQILINELYNKYTRKNELISEARKRVFVLSEALGSNTNYCWHIFREELRKYEESKGLTPTPIRNTLPPREPSPFHFEDVNNFHTSNVLAKKFPKYLSKQYLTGIPKPSRRIAEILVSASLYGNLTSKAALSGLAKSLPNNVFLINGSVLYVNIEMGSSILRWYPDRISAALITGFLRNNFGHTRNTEIEDELKSLINILLQRKWTKPLSRLSDIANARAKFILPPWVASIANTNVGNSIPHERYAHILFSSPDTIISSRLKKDIYNCKKPENIYQSSSIAFDIFHAKISSLFHRVNKQKRTPEHKRMLISTGLKSLFKDIQYSNPFYPLSRSLLLAFIQWSLELCEHGGLRKKHLRINTIEKYITQFSKKILPRVSSNDVTQLTSIDWTSIYADILSSEKDSSTSYGYILRFHNILERDWLTTHNPDWKKLAKLAHISHPNQISRRAHLISEYEYLKSLDFLIHHSTSEYVTRLQLASILILAYRCGLRHSEVFGIQCRDISLSLDNSYVLVYRSKHGDTKTKAAKRMVRPCPSWLASEREILSSLIKHCQTLPNSKDITPLMSDRLAEGIIDDITSCNYITSIIRSISGDDDYRFHDLRHNYVSRRMLSYAMSSISASTSKIPFFSLCKTISHAIGGALEHKRRDNIATVLQDIGHATLTTTSNVYTHFIGEILKLHAIDDIRISHRAMAYALSVREERVRQWHVRNVDNSIWFSDLKIKSYATSNHPDINVIKNINKNISYSIELPTLHRELSNALQLLRHGGHMNEELMRITSIASQIEKDSGYVAYGFSVNESHITKSMLRDMHVNAQELIRIDNHVRIIEKTIHDLPQEHLEQIDTAINLWIAGKRKYSDKISFSSFNDVASFLRGLKYMQLGEITWLISNHQISGTPNDIINHISNQQLRTNTKLVLTPASLGHIGAKKSLHRIMFLVATWIKSRSA